MTTTNHVWLALISDLLLKGAEVKPRDRTTREILGYQTRIPMAKPVLTVEARKLGYRFAVAEPAWIMSGDNRVSTIKPFSKMIHQFSDDGFSYFGAYGPKFVEQVSYVVDCLVNDPSSRQAVMTFWRERPRSTRDVPCTVALQWFIRGAQLHCNVTMRSSDAWLGWPYDVHTFSALSMFVLVLLNRRIIELKGPPPACYQAPVLGELILTAGSQHLYKSDWAAAAAILDGPATPAFDYEPFDPATFTNPEDLVAHYWNLAHRKPTVHTWLREIADRVQA